MTLLLRFKEKFNKALKKLPFNKGFEYYYNKGIDFYNKNQFEKAVLCFKQAIIQINVQPQVFYNLGLSYQHLKNYDEAIYNYNKFLEQRENDYDGLYNLALVYYNTERYDKSIELYEKCLEIKKEDVLIKALTLAYLNANEVQKALDMAEKMLNESKDGIAHYLTIAKVFEHKISFSKDFTFINIAIDMFAKVIEVDSTNFEAYISISICYAKKGTWDKSIEFCKKALEIDSKSYDANNQMGLIYYCCNDIDEAIKFYEDAMKLKPKGDFKIYSNLAYAYEKKGDVKKAIKIFNQLLNKFPNYPAKYEIKNHLRILKTNSI